MIRVGGMCRHFGIEVWAGGVCNCFVRVGEVCSHFATLDAVFHEMRVVFISKPWVLAMLVCVLLELNSYMTCCVNLSQAVFIYRPCELGVGHQCMLPNDGHVTSFQQDSMPMQPEIITIDDEDVNSDEEQVRLSVPAWLLCLIAL